MPKIDMQVALDSSARFYDADGRLHITRTHISKAAVNPYYGREIPGYERLGLEPDKIYRLLRHPDELAKGAPTFARLQILAGHVPVNAEEPQLDRVAGAIGSNVEFNEPYLDADVCIWTAEDIAGIESNAVREFSCSYRYVPLMTPGEWQGQEYDGIMTEIVGNHLALVEAGRAGSDVLAADEDITMKMTKMGKALYLALGGMSPKLAADSALPALVAQASGKTAKAEELAPKIIAMDSELDAEKVKKTLAAVLALDEEKDEKAEDEEEDEKDKKKAEDEEEDEKRAKDEEKKDAEKAMDSKIETMRQGLLAADEARRLVRPVVGDVIAHDSAEGIYGFALKEMGIAFDGVTGAPALKALFTAVHSRSTTPAVPTVAMDAAGLETMFPNATRF